MYFAVLSIFLIVNNFPQNTQDPGKHKPQKRSGGVDKSEIKNLKKRVIYPKVLTTVPVKYPVEQYRAGVESDVCLFITVGTKGEVIKVEVSKSGGKAFDTAAVAAAEKYTFSPATIDDLPVVVKVKLNIPFRIAKKKTTDTVKTTPDKKTDVKESTDKKTEDSKSNEKKDNKTGTTGTKNPTVKTETKPTEETEKTPDKPKKDPDVKKDEPVKASEPAKKPAKPSVMGIVEVKKDEKTNSAAAKPVINKDKTISKHAVKKVKLIVTKPAEITVSKDISEDENIVVTATLTARRIKDVPVKTEVISARKIQEKGATNLVKALDHELGVVVENGCSICAATQIRLSGMPGRYTLYLIDGMPLYSSLGSTYGLAGVPSASIGKVEIVKGGSSVLYGTDAIGGIVNVILKNPISKFNSAEIRIGTHEEYLLSAVSSSFRKNFLRKGDFFGIMAYASFENKGRHDRDGDGLTEIPEMQRSSAAITMRYKMFDGLVLKFRSSVMHENRQGGGTGSLLEVMADWDPHTATGMRGISETILSRRIENAFIAEWNHKRIRAMLNAAWVYHFQDSDYEGEYYKATQHIFYANPFVNINLGKNYSLTTGGSIRVEHLSENVAVSDYNYVMTGVFAEGAFKIGKKFEFLHGIRFDHHNEYGEVITPRLAAKYAPIKDLTFRASAGTAFRAPTTFYEYNHGVHAAGYSIEMAADKAETSMGGNASIVYSGIKGWNLTFEASYNKVKNAIALESSDDGSIITVFNVPVDLKVMGMEFQIEGKITSGLKLQLGYGTYKYQDPENVQQTVPPSQQFTGSLSYRFRRFSMNLSGKILAPMKLREAYGYAYNPVSGATIGELIDPATGADLNSPKREKSPWFGTANIVMEYRINQSATVYFGIDNIFDYHQSDIEGPIMFPSSTGAAGGAPMPLDVVYIWGPMEGRCVYGGLRLNL
ncbi:TonB-dependent receptor [Myxococcota bacterium]|nr:TonB-dependent receptor [Myxococcota bacterium]MBU1380991.1 TonB-dependent receptor [Myxococcota bacterium]MBU1496624.1 TonB-dependent receptor [Myxococcota bacterium]